MFALTLTHSDAHMRTRGEAGLAGGLLGSGGGGAFWALEHQHLAPSTSGTLVGKLCPTHRCEFVTAGEQRAATQRVPCPPTGAALLCSSWKASLWICKYFNSQKLKEGVGVGTGVARWPSLCLYPGLLQPPWWQQHSRDMQWCASTIHTRRSGQLATTAGLGGGVPAPASLGPGPEPGRLVTHRVRTATGYRSDKCSAPLMGSFLVV